MHFRLDILSALEKMLKQSIKFASKGFLVRHSEEKGKEEGSCEEKAKAFRCGVR